MPTTPPQQSRPARPNANTLYCHPSFQISDAKMSGVWEQARNMLLAAPRRLVPGYTLLYTNGREQGFFSLNADRDTYAIIGRHSECDLFLPSDDSISLRHLLARTIILEDKTVALRLLDLKTMVPFHTEDGASRRSIVVSGPLLFRVGEYVLGAVPHDAAERVVHGRGPYRQASLPRVVASQTVPSCAGRRPGRQTLITVLPAAPSLAEAASDFASGASARRITLSRGYKTATVSLSDAALEAGVLVGRATKCFDHGLRSLLNLSISRVHLLLLKDNERVIAFDLCSTQGTFLIGRRIRQVSLPSSGTSLTLGQNDPLDLWWHPVDKF